MSVLIHPLTELNQAANPSQALVSGASGLLYVQLNSSSQLGARGQGDANSSPLKINIFGCRWKRGILP